jgi:hypothetical protein
MLTPPLFRRIKFDNNYTQAEMVFGYYQSHPKALTLTLSQRERE